ncbi:MAG: hypothetical protein PHU51_04875 [Candidatus Nanoarchaeia archaeon]|nr:hypothetical protein [Candidatus Nanoarchaeia archaeon]
MNVKKNVKKIVALGAAALITATTFAGALAADLSNYPAPFVENGAFNGAIVVGAMAKTQDVIGAIDIGASLQAEAKTPVSTTGTSTATVSVEGGILLEDTTSQDFNFPDGLVKTLDKYDFPTLLADGELEDDDGTTYDYDQEIRIANATLTYSKPTRDFDEPVLNLVIPSNLLNFTVSFDTDVNVTALDNSESFEMFGRGFTFKNIGATDNVILYASDLTQTVTMGEPLIVEIDGKSYTIEILGANSDTETVHISVNGETRSVVEGNTRTIGGIEVYVQEVFISNIAGESASAKLFIGSEEYDLGKVSDSPNSLYVNSNVVDGVEVYLTNATGALSQIDFVIDATDIVNEALDEDYDFLELGDSFVDPVFGFKLMFVEMVPGFTEGRDKLAFVSDDELTTTFTNVNGDTFSFEVYAYNSTSADLEWAEDFVNESATLAKNNIVIVEEASTSSKPVSIVYKFTGATNTTETQEATFQNLATSKEITVKSGGTLGKSSAVVNVTDRNVASITNVFSEVNTESGARVQFAAPLNATGGTANTDRAVITVQEDDAGVFQSEFDSTAFTMNVTIGTDSDNNDELLISAPLTASVFVGASNDGNKIWYGINDFGTYAVQDGDDDQYLDLYMPFGEADFNVYLAPPNAVKVVSAAAATGDAYVVNPAGLGVGILDIDAPALGSKPMIVVGGPAVNTVAAELMGNPTWEQMTETFETGKAMIKFYSAENAVLVAGWDAIETQAACNVLVNYKMYDLTGDEMEVIVTSLDNIKVNPVN